MGRLPLPLARPAKALVADGRRQDPGRSSGSSHQPRPSRDCFPVTHGGAGLVGTDGGGPAPDLHGIPYQAREGTQVVSGD